MREQSHLLSPKSVTAASYNQMFAGMVKLDPELKQAAEWAVQWAKGTLKRDDRVAWYLRWWRYATLDRWMKGLPSRITDPQMEEAANEGRAMRGEYGRSLLRGGATATDLTRTWAINEVMTSLDHFMGMEIPEIQNFTFKTGMHPMDLVQAMRSIEYQYNLGSKSKIVPKPEDTAILKFADGWAWWLLPRASCSDEAKAMGHCGNSPDAANPNAQILSLREPHKRGKGVQWEPHCTFIFNKKNGTLGEMKGKNNDKPVAKYHSYIVALLKMPMIKKVVGGGYKPSHNFKLRDLSPEMLKALHQARPDLAPDPDNPLNSTRIIELLGLEPNAWNEEEDTFIVGTYSDAGDFLTSASDGARDLVAWWRGSETPDDLNLSELWDKIEKAANGQVTKQIKGRWERVPAPDYCANIGYELLYADPKGMPEGFDPTDWTDVYTFLEEHEPDDWEAIRYDSVWGKLRDLWYTTQPSQSDAESEIDSIMERFGYEAEGEGDYHISVDASRLDRPVTLTISGDTAEEVATQVEDGGKIPNWVESMNVRVDDYWQENRERENEDYTKERLEEDFGVRPRNPYPEGQERLFTEPKTDEEAERDGIKISRLLMPKQADIPENLQKLDQPMDQQTDAIKHILMKYRENGIDTIPWRLFQQQFQRETAKFPALFNEIRHNKPQVTYDDLSDYLYEHSDSQAPYGVSYDTYNDGEHSFRDAEQLVVQINEGADASNIIRQDSILSQYVDMVRQSSTYSGHPSADKTVGWLRVDFIDQDYLLVDEVQSDLVNSTAQAKAIVENATFAGFMASIQNEKVKDAIREKGVDARQYANMRRSFLAAGYSAEKLEQIKRKLQDLFKNWSEYAMSSILEIARRNDVKNVVMHSSQSLAQRDEAFDSQKAKIFYDNLAKSFGFKQEDISAGELKGRFWVRKVAAKPTTGMSEEQNPVNPDGTIQFVLFAWPVQFTDNDGGYEVIHGTPWIDAWNVRVHSVRELVKEREMFRQKFEGKQDAVISTRLSIQGFSKEEEYPLMRGLKQYYAEGPVFTHKTA